MAEISKQTLCRNPNGIKRKSITLHSRELRRKRLHVLQELKSIGFSEDIAAERPKTRAECKDGPRPCPWVGCKHHLALDVNPVTGAIKLNFPNGRDPGTDDVDFDAMVETCALDVADKGEHVLEDVGGALNLTRERVRQIEEAMLARMEDDRKLADHYAD